MKTTPDLEYNKEISIDENINESKKFTDELRQRKKNAEHADLYQHSFKVDEKSDKLCCWLQILHHALVVLLMVQMM